jgi:hypothetical protein
MFTAEDGRPTPPERPAPPKNHAGGEVVVATNLPMGMVLQIFDIKEQWVAAPTGGHMEKVGRARPQSYRARGNAVDMARVMEGTFDMPTIVNNYALTPGIPKDFWDEWLAQNLEQAYVVNHCIFAEVDEARVRARARARGKENKSGLERIDRNDPSAKSRELQGSILIREMARDQ